MQSEKVMPQDLLKKFSFWGHFVHIFCQWWKFGRNYIVIDLAWKETLRKLNYLFAELPLKAHDKESGLVDHIAIYVPWFFSGYGWITVAIANNLSHFLIPFLQRLEDTVAMLNQKLLNDDRLGKSCLLLNQG